VYIVEGFRTPFCKFGTDLADEPVINLGVSPSKALFSSTTASPDQVDHVVFGCCNQPGDTLGNVARTIGVRAGVPVSVPAVTVHRNCASGFEAITYACDKATAGKGDVFLVGGVESMSQAPFLFNKQAVKKFTSLSRAKTLWRKWRCIDKFRPSDFSPEVSLKLGMVDSLVDMSMGQTAELLAREYNITRTEQDRFAENSHLKALAARACDRFEEEISPFYSTNSDCIRSFTDKIVLQDNGIRNDAYVDKLSKLRCVFDKKGTVTAGNASQVTDGGAAMLLMTEAGLRKTGCTPIGRIADYAYAGCDPKRMGLGPIHAIDKLSKSLEHADLVEINEAFAAQVIACRKELDIPDEKFNVNGGAIALGHPLAATGVRLVLSLIKELNHRHLKSGLASLCVGGGQGGAIWIESN
jgi:acetyl-CoA C-acetyltransferase/acetyl-CoA acyltransferase